MAAQMITAIPHASAVVDEPAHLTSGYLSLVEGDLTVNREHPPFIKALAALPLLAIHPVLPAQDNPKARTTEDFEFDYSRRFLYKANDADRLLRVARLPIVALTLFGGAALFFWARTLLGDIGALAALALYAFEPNLLAHGRLVTTDMGAAVFALVTFACLQRAMYMGTAGAMGAAGAASRRWAIAAGAALGLALLSRFSSLLLVPLLIAAAIAASITDGRRPPVMMVLLVVFLVAIVLVNVGYGFTGGFFPLAHDPIGGALKTQPLAAMESSPTLRWLPIPLPRLYIEGLDLARYKNQSVEGPGYLNGKYSSDGWWSYFLLALGMKTTLPFIALVLAGLAVLGSKGRAGGIGIGGISYVALPALGLLLLITATTRAQIGLRYALPVIPFLCIAGGAAAAAAAARLPGRRRAPALVMRTMVAALLGWHAWAALAIHPYHLAYFNELSGGPDRGYLHLVDSNLDWGQDLVGVKRFMQDKGLSKINLYYFGTADPEYYGIQRPLRPEPGYYAVSATHLMGVYLPDHDYLADFRAMRPVSIIGHSIFIYELREIPPGLTRSQRR